MRSQAKASTAGSNRRRVPGLGLALLAAIAAAVLVAPASQAAAEVVKVNLAGGGHGSVRSSSPTGIECSNVGGGAPGPTCSADLVDLEDFHATLAAKPDAGSYFAGWALVSGFGEGCTTPPQADPACHVFLFASPEATASFEPLPDRPLATTGGSSLDPVKHLVTLEGSVNPAGFKVSDCRFEYGPSAEYGSETPCVPGASELGEGSAAEPVGAEIETEELKPATAYHYRLVATNLGGTAAGGDREFTTAAAPADSCPNSSFRNSQVLGAILLPDCMALEMVSPPQKAGQPAHSPVVSAEGERVLFVSGAPLAETPGVVSPLGDPYVASRGAAAGKPQPRRRAKAWSGSGSATWLPRALRQTSLSGFRSAPPLRKTGSASIRHFRSALEETGRRFLHCLIRSPPPTSWTVWWKERTSLAHRPITHIFISFLVMPKEQVGWKLRFPTSPETLFPGLSIRTRTSTWRA
jgi:hypothetical protein